MKAFETITNAINPPAAPDPAPARPDAAEVTSWLLEGRFFTVDQAGSVTSWSPLAAEVFGWQRKDVVGKPFVDTLLVPEARAGQVERLETLLQGGGGDGLAPFTGDVDALDARERPLRAAFAMVPIGLGVGYEFNALLQDISTRSGDAAAQAELKSRHESVLTMVEAALGGGQGGEVAGAVIVFQSGAAAPQRFGSGRGSQVQPAGNGPTADNVVSIADAPGAEETRAQLERARRDAEDARVEIRSLTGQLEEARREAQRSRNDADVARQEAGDARDALVVAQRGAEEARRQLEDTRRMTDEVRAVAEASRIRGEEAQREADNLRGQLREARDSVRGLAGRADDDLAQAQEREAHAARELIEARAEAARHEAEVEPLRERYQAAQRELGSLRADLESAQAAAAERETIGTRRAEELERLRAELESTSGELAAVREQLEEARASEAAQDGLADEAQSIAPSDDTMRRALEDDLFQLHCQPVLDLHTNTVTQYELLLRMTGEDGRLILPQAFLGTARRAGLAHAIDRWVVRRAIRLLHETALAGQDVSLEVNLSPEAVHDPDLAVLIDQELAGTPIDPARLVLEVTGDTASAHLEETRALAKRLRGLGCRFALDDFRSNFGSFNLLRDIPLDYLKLDGELVGSVAESRTSQLIVKALVDVAAGAGMKTVAVFVSDDETLDMLRRQGVDYAQGYTVGRPQPVEEVLRSAP